MPDFDPATNGDDDDGFTVETVDHGELFISHPYVGSALGVIAAVTTGIILAVWGTDLIAFAVAAIVGALVGGIAGFVMVMVGMSFSAEQAGYGREMREFSGKATEPASGNDEPSLGFQVVGWLYLPLPLILGIGTTLLIAYLLR